MTSELILKMDTAKPHMSRMANPDGTADTGEVMVESTGDEAVSFGAVFLAGEELQADVMPAPKQRELLPDAPTPTGSDAPSDRSDDPQIERQDDKPLAEGATPAVRVTETNTDAPVQTRVGEQHPPNTPEELANPKALPSDRLARAEPEQNAHVQSGNATQDGMPAALNVAKQDMRPSAGVLANPNTAALPQQQPDAPTSARQSDTAQPKDSTALSTEAPKSDIAAPRSTRHRHILESVLATPAQTRALPRALEKSILEPAPNADTSTAKWAPPVEHTQSERPELQRVTEAVQTKGDAELRFQSRNPDPQTEGSAPTGAVSGDAPPKVALKPAPMPTIAQSVFAGLNEAQQIDADTLKVLHGEATEVVQWDMRGVQSGSHTVASTLIATRAELPPHVAQQLAVALQKSPDKPIELALNPPELGRVRMVLSASEAGVVVQVLAERSDTLDLMRRNIDDLGRALSDLGYEDISFSFGQGDPGDAQAETDQHQEQAHSADVDGVAPVAIAVPALNPTLAIAPDSIDIRL